MKKIVVTGGSGFIGTNLVNFLLKKNYTVINIDKLSIESVSEKNKKISNLKKYFFKKIDLCNKKKIFKALKKIKPKFIIHLAAETHVDRSIDDPEKFIKNNIMATSILYNTVNKLNFKKIKIIHISTDEVFGNKKKGFSKENDPFQPTSPYSSSKAGSDLIAKSFFYTFNLPIVIINICNNYGPYQFSEKFIPKIIINILNKKKIPVYGDGKNIREWMFVEDCCDAIYQCILRSKPGLSYNIGSNIRLNNIYLIKKIIYIFRKFFNQNLIFNNIINFVKDRPAHDFRYALNSNYFKKNIVWKCKTNLETGLLNTINWYIKNKNFIISCKRKYDGRRQGLI